MNNIYLKNIESDLKNLLSAFLITMAIGIGTGLVYVYLTTNMTTAGTEERFNGSKTSNITDIPEEFPKPLENMILTTHNHIMTFAIISLLLGVIFYFNSTVSGKLKTFIIIEPFIAILITFTSMWIMRYIYPFFSIIMVLSAVFMYICWYAMIGISLYELLCKKK